MIKNIIFDLGNVIINYDQQAIIDRFAKTDDEKEYLMENNFKDKGCEKTPDGVKDFFYKFEGLEISYNEANCIYEKYLKVK